MRAEHQREVEKLKKQLANAKRKGEGAGGEDEEGESEDEAEDTAKELELARKKRVAMRELWAEDDPMVHEVDAQIDQLLRKRDKDKPARVRINVLDRRMAAAQKKLEARTEEVREVERKIAGLLEERKDKVGQLRSAKQAVEKLKAEHTEELQRALGEGKETVETTSASRDADAAVALLRKETISRLPKDNPGVGVAIDQAFSQLISLLAGLPREPTHPESAEQGGAGTATEGTGETTGVTEGGARMPGAQKETKAAGCDPQSTEVKRSSAEYANEDVDLSSSDGEDGCDESMFEDIDLQMLEGETKTDLNKRVASRLAEKLERKKKDRRERKGKEGKRLRGKQAGGEAGVKAVVKK